MSRPVWLLSAKTTRRDRSSFHNATGGFRVWSGEGNGVTQCRGQRCP